MKARTQTTAHSQDLAQLSVEDQRSLRWDRERSQARQDTQHWKALPPQETKQQSGQVTAGHRCLCSVARRALSRPGGTGGQDGPPDTDTPPHARDEKSGFHRYHCNTASTQPCRQSTGPPAPKPKTITVREARGDLLSFPLFIFPLWVWGPKEMLGSHLGEPVNLRSKPNKGDEASAGCPRGGVNGNEGVEFV